MKKILISVILALFIGVSLSAVWTNEEKETSSDGAEDDFFGFSVSIAGNYAVIGAFGDDDNGTFSGSAYIFYRNGTSWSQQAKLTPSDESEADYFGYSVSIDGDYALIGAINDEDNGYSSGSAYIFHRSGTSWSQQAKLTASDGEEDDIFGFSVSIAGNYAVIGAFSDDDNGITSGSAYIFHRHLTSWSQQAKLTPSDGSEFDSFGYSVSINGDYALIGAYNNDDNGINSGSAYIFHRNGTSWSQQTKLTASDAAAGDEFGRAVSINGNYGIIGAALNDDNGNKSGSAYIFFRNGTSWSQQAKLTASDAAAADYFGRTVSINGDYVAVGASYNDDNGSASGSAYIFHRSGTSWTQQTKLTASDAAGEDYFGDTVSISGNHAVIGAYGDDDNGSSSGSVYFYEEDGSPLPVSLSSFTAVYTMDGPTLGWTTQTETDNVGWNVYRSDSGNIVESDQINGNLIAGSGTTFEPTEYTYVDESQLEVNNTYYYWIENRDAAGVTETHGPISLTIPSDPGSNPDAPIIEGSIRNYPNPFYPTTEISFMMNEPGQVEVTIFNSKGQMVTTLFNDYYDEETFNVAWNGRDNSGKEVTSGVYMYVIKTDSGTYSRKMVITK